MVYASARVPACLSAEQRLGQFSDAEAEVKKILDEKYGKAHLGTYYQMLANKTLGQTGEYKALLGKLEAEARERTSGKYEYRGLPETIGYYLLSLVLEEKGDTQGAAAARQKAIGMDAMAARLSLREAQIEFAGAHQ